MAIPFAIAAEMLAAGKVQGSGILYPEEAFEPQVIFNELEKRDIDIHITTR